MALIDPGASSTVIRTALAKQLGGRSFSKAFSAEIEGQSFPLKLTGVKLEAEGCGLKPITAVVSDKLVDRSKPPVAMLLGHDYLQREQVWLLYAERAEDHKVACTKGSRGKAR